jgi:fibronectin-binding autotransporter adhesin
MRKSQVASVRSSRKTFQLSINKVASSFAAVVALHATTAHAQLFWDPSGTTAGATVAAAGVATGTWGGTTNWTTNTTGNVATVAWTQGSAASFSAGTNATGASVITVVGTQSLSSLTTAISTATYTFQTGTAAGLLKFTTGTINITASAGTTAIDGSMLADAVAVTAFNKAGTGILSLSGTFPFAAPINVGVNSGLVKINAGVVQLATAINIGGGGAFELDNTIAASNDRLSDTAPIGISGGNFVLTGNASTTVNETAGALTVNTTTNTASSLYSDVTVNTGSSATLTLASYTRNGPAALLFRGGNLGAAPGAGVANVYFTTAPTLTGGAGATGTSMVSVIPGAFASTSTSASFAGDFATYDVNGVRALTSSEYQNTVPDDGTATLINASVASVTLTQSRSINGLKLTGANPTITLGSGTTFTINDGVIASGTSLTMNGGTVQMSNTVLATSGANVTINSSISGTGWSKIGTGSLTLTNTNTYTGTASIPTGNVFVSGMDPLGGNGATTILGAGTQLTLSAATISAGRTIATGGQSGTFTATDSTLLALPFAQGAIGTAAGSGPSEIDGNIILNGTGGNSGSVNNNSIGVAAGSSLLIAGGINSGAVGFWFKTGPGTLTLTGTSNYSDIVRILGGTLILASPGAGGGSVNGFFPLAGVESTVALSAGATPINFTTAKPISISWPVGPGVGAFDNYAGNNTYAGTISTGQTYTNDDAGQSLFWHPNYIGVSAGSLTLTSNSTNNVTISSGSTTNGRYLIKVGAGNLILTNTATYSGIVDITTGTMTLAGAKGQWSVNVGTPVGGINSAMNIFPGATLAYDNSTGVQTSRFITNPEQIVLAGELNLIANATTAVNQSQQLTIIGSPTLTITNTGTSATTLAATTSGARGAGGYTMLVRGPALGGAVNQISFNGTSGGNAPTVVNGIVPWVMAANSSTSDATDFATYGANGFSVFTGYTPGLPDGTDTLNNVLQSDSMALTGPTGINAVNLNSPGSAIDLGGQILTVYGGTILASTSATPGVSTISNGTVEFGSTEGIIYTTANHSLNISAVIDGQAGLTIGGSGTTTLSGTNTYSGPTTVNSGELIVSSDANFGTSGNLQVGAGFIRPASDGVIIGAQTMTMLGKNGGFDVPANTTMTFGGQITGTGALVKIGAGTVVLTNSGNEWVGGTYFNGGVVSISNINNLGLADGLQNNFEGRNAELAFNGGTLQITSSLDMGKSWIYFGPAGGTIDVEGSSTNVTYDVVGGLTPMYGPGSFTKTGPGLFVFNSFTPTYSGGTNIFGGTLQITQSGTLPTGAYINTVNATGGKFQMNGTITTNASPLILGDGGALSAINGTATYSVANNPQVVNGANVTLEAVNSGDVLTITSAFTNTGGTSTIPTINVVGQGLVGIDAAPASTFVSNWIIDGTSIRDAASTNAFGAAANKITFTTNGGTLHTRNSTASLNDGNPVTINGNVNFIGESTSAAGGTAFTDTFGSLTIGMGNPTINLTGSSSTANGLKTGTYSIVFGATSIASDTTFTINNGSFSGNMSLGAIAAGVNNIIKNGAGTLTLTGANTITGAFTDTAGTIQINNAGGLGNSSGVFLTNLGTGNTAIPSLTLAGVNIAAAIPITATANGTNDRVQFSSSTGSSTYNGAIAFNGNGILQIVNSGNSMVINGAITDSSAGEILARGATAAAATSIGTFNGTITLPGGNFSKTDTGTWVINSSNNSWATTSDATGTIRLGADNALPAAASLIMSQAGGSPTLDLNGHSQTVGNLSINPLAVTGSILITNTNATPATFTINNSTGNTYGPTGAAASIGGALAVVKSGPGPLTFSGNNAYTGGTSVAGGALSIASDASLGAPGTSVALSGGATLAPQTSITSTRNFTIGTGDGTLAIPNGSSIATTGTITGTGTLTQTDGTLITKQFALDGLSMAAGTLQVTANGTVAGVSTLTSAPQLGGSAQLDLTNNDLVVNYTTASPISAISALLTSGYAGGAWNGAGINSSSAAADATQLKTLGYADAEDVGITSVDGFSLTGHNVVVKYTYIGDASLDGKVDLGNDMDLFLIGYLTPNASGWELGDFNYDGVVNNTDFGMLVDGLELQGTSLGQIDSFIMASPLLSSAQKASLVAAAVPEPSSIAAIAVAACGLAARRRRRGM